MTTRLTKCRLEAIREALEARLAAEIEDVEGSYEDYELALRWVYEQIAKRASKP